MLGALIGDVIGSVYEFNNHRSKDFVLFGKDNFLTDDSIMTLAVMEIMQKKTYNNKDKIIDTFKKWGRAYRNRGYGGMFRQWLFSNMRDSYNSFGNGAAMRISPVGYYAKNEEEVKEISKRITEVTHSHPEGIKGAEVTAMCIYYAKIGKSKDFIREYASKYYDLDFDYEELRSTYIFNEICQDTVPQAIYCFLISNDYEDCIRTTISIGGDSDTLAAISGAIAEAYYKHIDRNIIKHFIKYIPSDNNGCSCRDLILDYIDENSSIFASCEDIDSNTLILASIKYDKIIKQLDFNYSKRIDALLNSIIDKVLLSKSNITEEQIKWLNLNVDEIRKDDLETINSFLDYCTNILDLKFKFVIYLNPIEALNKIKIISDNIENQVYNDIFNKVFML